MKFKIDSIPTKKILIASAMLVSSILLLDFLIYKIIPKPCRFTAEDSVLKHKLIPNTKCSVKTEEYTVQYSINSYGLRDVDFREQKSKDTFRILVLGDSFTFGAGVNLEDTIVKQLEKNLTVNHKSKNFQVINAGVGGYSPISEYLYLKYHGINLKPDLVIFILSMTDFTEEYSNLRYVQTDQKGEALAIKIPDKGSYLSANIKNFLSNNSIIYDLFRRNEEKIIRFKSRLFAEKMQPQESLRSNLFAITNNLSEENFNLLFEPITTRLLQTKELLDSNGIPLVITIIPAGHQISPSQWAEGRLEFNLNDNSYPTKIFDEMDKFAKNHEIDLTSSKDSLISYLDNNPESKLYYDYDGHLTPLGQRIVADHLYMYLKNEEILPKQ